MSTTPHDDPTLNGAASRPPLDLDALDEFLDALAPSAIPSEVLDGDTVLGRAGSGKPHGKAADLLTSLNPGEFHALGCCPFRPDRPSPKGKNACVLVNEARDRVTVMCWAPDEHEHPADTVRHSNDGRTYSVWSWGPNRKASKATVESDDQSVLADHVLRLLSARLGLLAVRDEVIHVYDADGGKRAAGKEHHGCSPTFGSWAPLPSTAFLEFVRRSLAGTSVRVVTKDGTESSRPVRVTVRLVSDVATLMLRTLQARELRYLELMRRRGEITYDQQESATSRFEFPAGTLLNPGNVLNGNAVMEPARPSHHVTSDARIGFAPSTQHLAEWESYVARMIPDATDREAFQMWVGAAVVGGCATRLQQHVALLGPAGTGKSQLIELVASIFPPSQRAAVSLAQMSDRFSTFGLVGKRFNVSPEADTVDGRIGDVGRLKMILDGSTIQVERKNQQPVWARLTCAHLIGANALPAGDAGEALYDRFRVIRATDKRVRHEADAVAQWWTTKLHWRPSILAWAIDGLAKLDRAGWRLPKSESSKEAMEDWRAEGDSVFDWSRHLPPPPPADDRRAWASASATYEHYVGWCRAHGRLPVSDVKFGRLAKSVVEFTRSGGRAYRVTLAKVDPAVVEMFPPVPTVEERIRAAWDAHDTDTWAALVQAHPDVFQRMRAAEVN